MIVIIEPLDGATEETATANMDAFIEAIPLDLEIDFVRHPEIDTGGHYGFLLLVDVGERSVPIKMPGIALDRVRDTGSENIYELGKSGVVVAGILYRWIFATSIAGQYLAGVRS